MNILIINHYAGSPNHGMEYRPYHFAKEWIKSGHNITIIASSFSHVRFQQPKCEHSITVENIDDIQYVWLKTPEYHGNNFRRIMNMFSFTVQSCIRTLPIEKPDIVIDSSTYPLTIYGADKIARKYGARLIFEVHDLWPLSPMELGGYSKYHPFIIVMQRAENYAYKNAHRVISLLPKAKEHMISHGMSPEKFVYIPNGVDISSWQLSDNLPKEHKDLLKGLKRNDKFIVGYAGAHGIANALEHLANAARLLKNNHNIHFVLVGQGPLKNDLQSFVAKEKLDNISFLPAVSKMIVPDILNYFDVCYIALDQKPLFRFGVSPNKMFDYMMAAKPIINAIDAGNDLVKEIGCGVSVPPVDSQAIVNAVLYLYKLSQEDRYLMGQKGQNYVKTHLDYEVLSKKFLEGL